MRREGRKEEKGSYVPRRLIFLLSSAWNRIETKLTSERPLIRAYGIIERNEWKSRVDETTRPTTKSTCYSFEQTA